MNIQHEVPGIKSHHETLEYLSNLTPYSILFNRTVQQLRTKREATTEKLVQKNLKLFHTKINSHSHTYTQELLLNHAANIPMPSTPTSSPALVSGAVVNSKKSTTTLSTSRGGGGGVSVSEARDDLVGSKSNKTTTSNSYESSLHGGSDGAQHHNTRKVNTEKHLRKGKNHYRKEKHKNGQNINSTQHKHVRTEETTIYVSDIDGSSSIGSRRGIIRTTPVKISHLILKSNRTGDCSQVAIYSWILILTYVSFSIFLLEFLIVTESAVFTIAVVTGALPLIGIFWSLFEMTNQGTLSKFNFFIQFLFASYTH